MDGCLRIWETASNYCFRCYSLAPPSHSSAPMAVAGGLLKRRRPVGKATEPEDMDVQIVENNDGEGEEKASEPSAHVVWNPNPEVCLVAASL